MQPPLFVTGTDTGVGKTIVACALAAFASTRKKLDVGVMKPFEAGSTSVGGLPLPSDAAMLKHASGSGDELALINPYHFASPLAPETAGRLENIEVDFEKLDGIFTRVKNSHQVLFIEGAGGVLVPIVRGYFYVDLMVRWKVEALVVGRLGLGTINHTLLTCQCLERAGVGIKGVILNDCDGENDIAKKTNPEVLANYLKVPMLGVFPHLEHAPGILPDRSRLADMVAAHITTEPLFR